MIAEPVTTSSPAQQNAHKRPLKRMLMSIDDQVCPFGCTYCFAQFEQYVPPATLADAEADPGRCANVDVLYPACDSDLFARKDFGDILHRVGVFGKSVSVSTKAQIGNRAIYALRALQQTLAPSGAVVKVGISISTKYSGPRVEPSTPGYDARLRSLARLREENIPSALVLRPLLAEIPDQEYEEILSDCSGLTNRVLVGDEWLDQSMRSPRARIAASISTVSKAPVDWIPTRPEWSRRSMPGRVENLRQVSSRLGLELFESDLDIMNDVLIEGN